MDRTNFAIKPGKIYTRKQALTLFLAFRKVLDILIANVIESGRPTFTSEELLDLLSTHAKR